jgi:hypothetical protein
VKRAEEVSRAALHREAKERAELFLAIGEFIFEFLQLEFTIRFALATLLNLHDKFDAVTSPYDFATLCRVTLIRPTSSLIGHAGETDLRRAGPRFAGCI